MSSLTVKGGSGGNYFAVTNTGAGYTTTLDSGLGQDIVDVRGTTGSLNIDGQDGRDRVSIGQWTPASLLFGFIPIPGSPSTLTNIQGTVTVSNEKSLTDLTINDGGDSPGDFDLYANHLDTSASAEIDYTPAQLNSLTVESSQSGGSLLTVHDTPAGVPVTLDTGPSDTVNVGQTSGALEVFDAATGSATVVNANSAAHVEHIINQTTPLALDGTPTPGTINAPGEVDAFTFTVPQIGSDPQIGGTLSLQVTAADGTLDPLLALRNVDSYIIYNGVPNAGGGLLGSSDDSSPTNTNPSLSQYLLPGQYVVWVSGATQGAGAKGAYSLSAQFTSGGSDPYPYDATSATRLIVGANPQDIDQGDFNGDGFQDVAVANHDSGTVSVLLGIGDGSFQPAQTFNLLSGDHPDRILATDYNGDGRLDLLTWDKTTNLVTVLLGTGNGSFVLGQQHIPAATLEAQPKYAALFDDQLAPSRNLTLTTSTGSTYTTRGVVADFNRDGIPTDFVALVPNGDGTNASYLQAYAGTVSNAAAVIDYPPLTDYSGGPFPVGDVLPNTNQVEVDKNPPNPPQSTPLALTIGKVPAVVEVDSAGNILLRLSQADAATGSSTFSSPVVVADPNSPAILARAIALVGNDPMHPEIAGVSLSSPSVFVYRGTVDSNNKVSWQLTFDDPLGGLFLPTRIAVGDLNGDGQPDLVVANSLAGLGSVSIFLNQGNGTFRRVPDIKTGISISDVLLSDPTKSGYSNIIVTDDVSGDVGVLTNQDLPSGAVGFNSEVRTRAGLPAGGFGVEYSVQTYIAQANPLTNGLLPAIDFSVSSLETGSGVLGNFTGSGYPDLVVTNRGTNSLTLLQGNASGDFFDPQPGQTWATGNAPGPIVAGYFNGTSKPLDLAVLNEGDQTIWIYTWIYTGDGQGHFSHTFTIAAGSDPTGLSVMQDTQTGNLDLLVGNTFGDVLRLEGKGDGTFQPPPTLTGKNEPLSVQMVNGQPEVILANQAADTVTLEAPTAGGMQYNRVGYLTDSNNSTAQLAPGAVQLVKLNPQSQYYDAVVVASGSNRVLVYHGIASTVPGELAFDPTPDVYSVGTDPVNVTVANVTGNADGVPSLLVVNKGSNDVSELFGSIVNGQWMGTAGERLKSGGLGPIAVNVVPDANSPGGFDLTVTNGGVAGSTQPNGSVVVLPGRGQGFFNDQTLNPQPLPSPVTQAPTVNGDIAVAPTPTGQLIGFNLETGASLGVLFTPAAGQGVDAVTAFNGNFFVAEQGGRVEELNANFDPVESFTSLNGTPQTPSAIDVLSDKEVLVTNAGEAQVFVFNLAPGSPGTQGSETTFGQALVQALEPATPGSTPLFTATQEAPLVVVPTLVADTLSTGQVGAETAIGVVVGQGVLAQLAQQAQPDAVGGNAGAGVAVEGALANLPVSSPDVDGTLRRLDLDAPLDVPDPLRPVTRRSDDQPSERLLAYLQTAGWIVEPTAFALPSQQPNPSRTQQAVAERQELPWLTCTTQQIALHEAIADATLTAPPAGQRSAEPVVMADGPQSDGWWLLLPALAASIRGGCQTQSDCRPPRHEQGTRRDHRGR